MDQQMPREYRLAADALAKKDKRQAISFGKGATTGAVALSSQLLDRLTEYLNEKWTHPARANAPEHNLERMLRQLEPELVALVCLQTGLHIAAHHQDHRQAKTFRMFADNLEAECYRAKLFKTNSNLAKRATQYAATQHASQQRRHATARAVAKKAGFIYDTWSPDERMIAGVWCANLLTDGLPDVFKWHRWQEWDKTRGVPITVRVLLVEDSAQAFMRDAVRGLIQRHPVWLPRLSPPQPWTGFYSTPSEDVRVLNSAALMKIYNKPHLVAVRRAIHNGSMAPTLVGINALQAVPYKINSWLLGVMEAVLEDGLHVPGFSVGDPIPVPERLTKEQWDTLTAHEKKLAADARQAVRALNRQRSSDLTLRAIDLEEAHRLANAPEFYLPMSMDFRGRVYPLPRFNFQRGDHVRALFLFSRGAPITQEGIYWLRVHVANCWAQKGPDGIGLDKKPLSERVQWTQDNEAALAIMVEDPLNNPVWTEADSPFLFLAAARELVTAIASGPDYICHLPVSFDGSCSGLQHVAGAMRAEEGKLVNLTDTDAPLDIYSIVADEARRIIEADAVGADEAARKHAQLFLSYPGGIIDRKLLKRNCMTYCYSSEATGMGDQQYEDLMVPLQAAATRTQTPHHFGTVKEQAAAARYMGRVAYAAITKVVRKPAEAMGYLKAVAAALAHEGKPVRWTTPAGLPCMNSYHAAHTKTVQLWLHNEKISVNVGLGGQAAIMKRKCTQAIAPNVVHSLDAAHLLLTAGAAAAEGITDLATVHDSFGCLPTHATRFNQIIREQFIKMYQEHDVLTAIGYTAGADLTEANHWRLPPLPQKGTLDLNEVLQAKYAFA